MVSGGSDSVALARLLPQLYPQNAYTVLHINHQLRGEDADEDERFVVDLATRLGLPCVARRVDVATHAAQTGDNLEQAGRVLRYGAAQELLDELCERYGCDPADGCIATAHTRDDRVETFFMRAIVGGGAGALSSIPYRNGRVVRPLLDCSREQLRDYLLTSEQASDALSPSSSASNIASAAGATSVLATPVVPADAPIAGNPWREDDTNGDTARLRAFVRHEVMPLAQTRNPRLLETVTRSLDTLACDDAFLTRLANELAKRFVTWSDDDDNGSWGGSDSGSRGSGSNSGGQSDSDGGGSGSRGDSWGSDSDNSGSARIDAALFAEDQALVRRVVKAVCERVVAPGVRLTSAHIVRIAEQGNRVGFVTVVPGDVMVANEYGTLVFRRKTDVGVSFCLPSPPLDGSGLKSGQDVTLREGHPQQLWDGRRIELVRVASGAWESDPEAFARAHASDTQVFIDGEALERAGGVLRVSGIRPGDRFCPLGMQGHHRLVSDVLIDRKIPLRTRAGIVKVSVAQSQAGGKGAARGELGAAWDTVPDAVQGKEDSIVWVVGIQLDERFKVDATTTAMFSIIVSKVSKDERTQHHA
jgi:tRNA(Ile)-lysidine synthase